ncbi:CidA/LrgA family protein [Trichococcus shcherbakoviae]|uniref:CidA/LrgA family protein n=1 Tax=Trichococcus shcherbakoviae TaxID=2094020 RepID=UPI002AA662E2|nr:CidA/LrgA family protein [Trichococcus shcherbakoviae]
MHYLKQFTVIIAISAVSELLAIFIPLPVPASIYGMSLLFLVLMTGVLKLKKVESAANLLLGIMPALFVVSGAGLITSYGQIAENFASWIAVNIGSTIVILATTGLLAQGLIRRKKAKEADGND